MKILWLSQEPPCLPARNGFALYGASLLRHLAGRHEVDLISFTVPGQETACDWGRKICATATAIPYRSLSLPSRVTSLANQFARGRAMNPRAALEQVVGEDLKRGRWDLVHVEGGYAGGLLGSIGVPALLSVHDAETLRLRELANCGSGPLPKVRFRLLEALEARFERIVYPRFDLCLVVNQRDKDVIGQIAPDARVKVLPNGVDVEYFSPLAPHVARPCSIVFHGNLSYPPNAEAAIHLAREILPLLRERRPETTLQIVGSQAGADVLALGRIPGISLVVDADDLRPHLGAASVYACGVSHGSGIKNKILEAMAMALPVVSYRAAASGIGAHEGREILLADTAGEFAAAVEKLFADAERAQAQGRAAREFVSERYCWGSRARELEAIYQEMLEARKQLIQKSN
jgi:glycosyltransferase involved in cell wall biosynthesis